jgi:RNA polymerase sigma factor (sigma-70 family)
MKQDVAEDYSNHSSMADLYERTAPALFAYARSRLSSQEDAEDILVEVFLAALEWKGFSTLTSNEQFAWLRGVIQHKIIDRYRQMGRSPTITLQHVEMALSIAESENPEEAIIRQEELRQLQATIHCLPPLQQQVLFLHFVDGLRCIEIASILGKRDGTIRVLLSRSLNHLRDTYQK